MGTDETDHRPRGPEATARRTLAIELQTSASLVDAALRLLTEHWDELSDDRRRQVLESARERAHHVAHRLDETVEGTPLPAPEAEDAQGRAAVFEAE
jgi:hypothetical protein